MIQIALFFVNILARISTYKYKNYLYYAQWQGSPHRNIRQYILDWQGTSTRVISVRPTMCWYARYNSIQLGIYYNNSWSVHRYKLIRWTMLKGIKVLLCTIHQIDHALQIWLKVSFHPNMLNLYHITLEF